MLRALVEDLLLIPGMQVVTTWDRRLASGLWLTETPGFEIVPVAGPDEEREVFRRLCDETDASYIIAPELHDELFHRATVAFHSERERCSHEPGSRPKCLNSSVAALHLCSDKWALFQHLTGHSIPTIPTFRWDDRSALRRLEWPRVLKLRLGAGSQSMQLVTSPDEWERAISLFDGSSRETEAIVQPYVPGTSLSVGVIIDRNQRGHRLPVADQCIDPSRGFAYEGGRIPSSRWCGSLDRLLDAVLPTIPGLFGYLGIDVLIPDAAPETPLLVEINPRLTTSYTGYRQLCRDNLAAMWLSEYSPAESLRWRSGQVEFDSAGECS